MEKNRNTHRSFSVEDESGFKKEKFYLYEKDKEEFQEEVLILLSCLILPGWESSMNNEVRQMPRSAYIL